MRIGVDYSKIPDTQDIMKKWYEICFMPLSSKRSVFQEGNLEKSSSQQIFFDRISFSLNSSIVDFGNAVVVRIVFTLLEDRLFEAWESNEWFKAYLNNFHFFQCRLGNIFP